MTLLSRRQFISRTAFAALAAGSSDRLLAAVSKQNGPFQPNWDSLAQYQTPGWFRDAKFGMWAHWGPQCVPEQGDWYARSMYQEGSYDYDYQCAHYGHPSKIGFKDITRLWKAEAWQPHDLVALYKRAGARYFMALANHHDNFDNWHSKYQPWNSVAIGPKKDLIGGWAQAAKAAGLPFAVSVHAAHAWSWYEVSQGADKKGPLAGVPYDGNMRKTDGSGLWWEGYDPQDLYAQNHVPGRGLVWDWDASQGSSIPDAAYCEKFYNRVVDLIDNYNPAMIYFDDTILPLYPISDVGLRLASYFYNQNMKRNHGKLDAVITGKILSDQQRKCLVLDIERGQTSAIDPLPYQSDTCIGNWHYDINLFNRHGYKQPDQIVHMLVDIVSKNGNLMLNIPLPPNGAPDTDALGIIAGITEWMDVNSKGIYGSRPWKVCGEGPTFNNAPTMAQGFNEKNLQFTAQDFRFMTSGQTLWAYGLGWPENGQFVITSLAANSQIAPGAKVERVTLLGAGDVRFTQDATGLRIMLPEKQPCRYVYGLKIEGQKLV